MLLQIVRVISNVVKFEHTCLLTDLHISIVWMLIFTFTFFQEIAIFTILSCAGDPYWIHKPYTQKHIIEYRFPPTNCFKRNSPTHPLSNTNIFIRSSLPTCSSKQKHKFETAVCCNKNTFPTKSICIFQLLQFLLLLDVCENSLRCRLAAVQTWIPWI